MARKACSRCLISMVSLCALTLASTAYAGFIPFERSRTVLSSAAIIGDAPTAIASQSLETLDRMAFERGFATNTQKNASADSAAMLVSNGFDGGGRIDARATVISEATMVGDEYGFAAAITTFTVLFKVTDRPLEVALDWSIWIGLEQLVLVETAEVMLESLSEEKPIAGSMIQRTKRTDDGSFEGLLEPGTYRLSAKAVAVANTDVQNQDHLITEAGFDFSFAVVPTPGSTSLFAIALCSFFRRARR